MNTLVVHSARLPASITQVLTSPIPQSEFLPRLVELSIRSLFLLAYSIYSFSPPLFGTNYGRRLVGFCIYISALPYCCIISRIREMAVLISSPFPLLTQSIEENFIPSICLDETWQISTIWWHTGQIVIMYFHAKERGYSGSNISPAPHRIILVFFSYIVSRYKYISNCGLYVETH